MSDAGLYKLKMIEQQEQFLARICKSTNLWCRQVSVIHVVYKIFHKPSGSFTEAMNYMYLYLINKEVTSEYQNVIILLKLHDQYVKI